MGRPRELLRGSLYRYGWDTRCRHRLAARLLREATAGLSRRDGPVLLDVGSGHAGMAAFLPDVSVHGVDLEPPRELLPNACFTCGSIADLPFGDGAFAYVSCVDVLQALPLDVRERGVSELLRVARDGVLIATPQGRPAARCDAEFERALVRRGAVVPPWVPESQAQPYPTLDPVLAAIGRADPRAEISVFYSEPTAICRAVRAAAARSRLLYAFTNLLFGLLLDVIPSSPPERSYRVIVFARFSRPGAPANAAPGSPGG